jgi:L-lactate dehydrogenase
MSVPSIVNRGGVEAVLELPVNDAEAQGLRHSADTIRKTIRALGF